MAAKGGNPMTRAILVVLAAALAACSGTPGLHASGPAAVGQRIYDAGIGPNGDSISRSGGVGMMGGAGCASCHGTGGHGSSTMMLTAPDITYANLTDPAGMIEPDGGHGMVYADTLIRRAVIEGIGADGETLPAAMPRWQLTDTEWRDLLAYLKLLD